MTTNKASALALALCLSFFAAGCKKKVGIPPPPPKPVATTTAPPAAVAKPMVKFFTAEPTTIERGQASSLRWEVIGADTASINQGLGVIGNTIRTAQGRAFAGSARQAAALNVGILGLARCSLGTAATTATAARSPSGYHISPIATFGEGEL